MLQPPKKIKRPDTPLAPTPKPMSIVMAKSKKDNNGGYAEGVVISRKDEKAHPEDFKYLKK
jgi:hypothetical protein